MKIAVILAFSLCLIAYSAAQNQCCPSVADCTTSPVPCTDATDKFCKITWSNETGTPVATIASCGPKGKDAGASDCDSDAPEGPCYCEAKPAADDTKECLEKARDKYTNPPKPEPFKCCNAKDCPNPTTCPSAAEIYCSWSTTAEGLMEGVKCAAAGNDKKCDANTVVTTCSCKNSAGSDMCNKGFVREDWEIKPDTGTKPTVPGNPTTPTPPETTEPNGSASVRATILTTVYPVITILGVALFSFSPA